MRKYCGYCGSKLASAPFAKVRRMLLDEIKDLKKVEYIMEFYDDKESKKYSSDQYVKVLKQKAAN